MTEQDILIMNSDSTHVDVELSFDNGINTIKNNKIYSESMSLIDSISDSESIVFGKCNISQFQVKVADFEGNIDGALMNVLLKFSNAELGTCEYNLGQYIVSDSERTSDKMFRVITAYDKMSLFNVDIANWYNYTLFPFEVVDNNLGWLPVNENGVVIDLTYSIAGEPQTSLDKNDDGAYYLNTDNGTVYVGYATYDESGEFASVEWRTYLQCEKNESYTESCNVTRTVYEILSMLCEYVGVTYNTDFVLVNGDVVVKRDFNPQSLNGLDFLQQICELNGVFGHINNNGILDFVAPDKNTKKTVDTFKKCDYSEYTVQPINSVAIKYDSNDMGTAVTRAGIDKLNQYEIVGNIFLQSVKTEDELKTIAGNILYVIENVSYVPCNIEVKCGLSLELGDYITVNANTVKEDGVKSVSFDTLVLYRNISGIQSIFNRIEAKGTECVSKSSESLASQLQITKKTIDKLYKEYTANIANFMYLYSKAITTDSLDANVANIGTLNANSAFVKFITGDVINSNYIRSLTADIGYLTSDSAIITSLQNDKLDTKNLNAEVSNLGYLTADSAVITGKLDANQLSAEVAKLGYLDASMANIDFANLNKANIGQLFANVGLISSATITDGHVTGYLDSVEVNANKITAGTLAVDRLLIKDSSGNYKMATYDSSGNLVTTTIDGSVITERTITADHLVAGTITANEINMTNLVGNSAFVNAINTNSIVVSASNNASSALSTANTANTNASNALNTANTANSNASTAINTANSASSNASTALTNANIAKGTDVIIDLTSSTYDQNMYYPVTFHIPGGGIHEYSCNVELYGASHPIWATHGNGFTVNLVANYKASVWGVTDGTEYITEYYCKWISGYKMPVFACGQCRYNSKAIFMVRGGGKYYFHVPYGCDNYSIYTQQTNIHGSDTYPWWVNPVSDPEVSMDGNSSGLLKYFRSSWVNTWTTTGKTTIDGGSITADTIRAAQIAAGTITSNEIAAGTITADKINLNDLFAQNITASGTITGATLKGAHVEATSGFIGNWNIINGSIVNEVTEDKGNQLLITRKTELKANSSLVFSTIDYAGNHTTEISGNNIICASSVAESTIRPNEIKVIGTAILGNPYSSITPSDIYEGSVALKDKYVSKEQINGITSFNIVNGELYIVANGVEYKFAPDGVIV